MDKKTKGKISHYVLIGKNENINDRVVEELTRILNIPRMNVEYLDLKIEICNDYKYVD